MWENMVNIFGISRSNLVKIYEILYVCRDKPMHCSAICRSARIRHNDTFTATLEHLVEKGLLEAMTPEEHQQVGKYNATKRKLSQSITGYYKTTPKGCDVLFAFHQLMDLLSLSVYNRWSSH